MFILKTPQNIILLPTALYQNKLFQNSSNIDNVCLNIKLGTQFS